MATNMKETHGIEIPYSKKGIFKSQQKYFMDLLRQTNKNACKSANTSIDPCLQHEKGRSAVEREIY